MIVTRRILIADDQATDRLALREILGAEPTWETHEASDGEEAMDRLCLGPLPDLCLLDLRMPRLDGMEALRRIRRDPLLRTVPIIITSGTRDKATILTLAKLSIAGYILKPYDTAKVLATLRPLVARLPHPAPHYTRNLLQKTLLLVEDSDTDRAALREILGAVAGWELVSAHDGTEALGILQSGVRPELIFADLRMPGMDGLTFIHRLREDPALRNLRVVVASADQDRVQVCALAQLAISGYLLKPFDIAKVQAALLHAAGEPVPADPAKIPAPLRREATLPAP